ncbi:hypothetical protein BDW66DRAFT_142297 [Aspergillus desertorum]
MKNSALTIFPSFSSNPGKQPDSPFAKLIAPYGSFRAGSHEVQSIIDSKLANPTSCYRRHNGPRQLRTRSSRYYA